VSASAGKGCPQPVSVGQPVPGACPPLWGRPISVGLLFVL